MFVHSMGRCVRGEALRQAEVLLSLIGLLLQL